MATTNPLQATLQAAVDDGAFPGAVLAVRLRGTLIYEGAVGRLSPQIPGEGVTIHTCYDLASLTKVLATTTALLLLMQRGKLTLDDRIDRILIALQGSAAGAASIHQLLTHSSGLPGWRPYYERLASLDAGMGGGAAGR
ncbi:MAG: beta-lactamase family protein [Nitrospira sp.]|nr:MAG: beta-lactamase family protein [Nitrospira sp.]